MARQSFNFNVSLLLSKINEKLHSIVEHQKVSSGLK